MFQRILVGLDGSPSGRQAFQAALELAELYRASLVAPSAVFDLDGTLIDSRLDLVHSVNATLRHIGRSIPPAASSRPPTASGR